MPAFWFLSSSRSVFAGRPVPRGRSVPVLATRRRRQDPRFDSALPLLYASRGTLSQARLVGDTCSGKGVPAGLAQHCRASGVDLLRGLSPPVLSWSGAHPRSVRDHVRGQSRASGKNMGRRWRCADNPRRPWHCPHSRGSLARSTFTPPIARPQAPTVRGRELSRQAERSIALQGRAR